MSLGVNMVLVLFACVCDGDPSIFTGFKVLGCGSIVVGVSGHVLSLNIIVVLFFGCWCGFACVLDEWD